MPEISIHLVLGVHEHLVVLRLPHHFSLYLRFSKLYGILVLVTVGARHVDLGVLLLIVLLLHVLYAILGVELFWVVHHVGLLVLLLVQVLLKFVVQGLVLSGIYAV